MLLKDDSTWNCEVAHIYGVKKDAARGVHNLSDEDLRDVSNLLLVCREHHGVIDNKSLEDEYTVERVQTMKRNHEDRYREAIAGLERIVDTSEGSGPRYPTNLRALDGFSGDDETDLNIAAMKPWIDAIAEQPPGMRDLLVLVLAHGKVRDSWSRKEVSVKATQIEGVAQIDADEIYRRARHLEDEGLLAIDEDEDIWYFELIDPTSSTIGWDMFRELHALADGDRTIIRRAIDDLDFTVFDQ